MDSAARTTIPKGAPDLRPAERAAAALALARSMIVAETKDAIASGEPLPGFSGRSPFVDVTQVEVAERAPARMGGRSVPVTRVRLKLWRLAAELRVEQNAETRELMAWRNRTAGSIAGEKRIGREAAVAIARAAVDVPPEAAAAPSVIEVGVGGAPAYEVTWFHFVGDDVIVDGDKVAVRVSAVTGEVTSIFKKWRKVPG